MLVKKKQERKKKQSNNSTLPSAIFFKTRSRLSSINFEKEDILKIIKNLNIDKAHGHDNISVQILKICDSCVLVEPLSLKYKNCINYLVFPDIWKRSHIIPLYKKIINVALITTTLFLYYQFVAKYLNILFITLYSYT